MSAEPPFIFICCQIGAEAALKWELARKWPAFRFAFSRPGFLTFKLPSGAALADDFDLHSVFARSYGFSLGKAEGATVEERIAAARQLIGDRKLDGLHVWQRDLYEPGHRGYEPGMTELATEVRAAMEGSGFGVQGSVEADDSRGIVQRGNAGSENDLDDGEQEAVHHPHPGPLPSRERERTEGLVVTTNSAASVSIKTATAAVKIATHFAPAHSARPNQKILDCIIVEPELWWLGYHRASSITSRWSGGLFTMELPGDAVSRAYLKMEEALAWSRLPLRKSDTWAEIGSAPGGASQALLGHGVKVIGIDPAEMDPAVVADPNFTHIKMRGADVRRREFREVRYLAADINVAPNYTLETVEHIVTHPEVRIQGLLVTLKLLDWKLAEELPNYLDRIRSWGYGHVRARQLHHNRQEVCVAAKRKE